MRTVIAIPAYNCAQQLPRVLDEIDDRLAARAEEIWVIDNRSTDGTAEVAAAYRNTGRLTRLRVFRNRGNYSLGGTHKAAFEHARAMDASHVLILHGDNQARSSEGNLLLDEAERQPAMQTVLGSRFSAGSTRIRYPRRRVWGNRVLNALYSGASGRKLEDLGSGLNLYALRDLDAERYLRFGNGLTFNYDLLLDLVRRRVRFAYVPITWRQVDEVSNARDWPVFFGALLSLIAWRLGRSRSTRTTLDYEWDEVVA